MAQKMENGGIVKLWAGWAMRLPPSEFERNQDGSFSVWGEDWVVDVTIVEMSNKSNGDSTSASSILGTLNATSSKINGKGWIGSKEVLREMDDGRQVFRLATKLCAENTFMSCWVSFFRENQLEFANALVALVSHEWIRP